MEDIGGKAIKEVIPLNGFSVDLFYTNCHSHRYVDTK